MRSFIWVAAICAAVAQEPEIRVVEVATGVANLTDIQNARDGSNRLFLAQQNGVIRILSGGVLLREPFLDIQARTRSRGECGLLGLAFPPGYVEKRYFYVNYTDPNCTNSFVSRFHLTSGDRAEGASEEILMTLRQPFTNHNGGQLAFGPDGYLYIGWGDGGSGGDPQNNGQSNRSLLGKMLRIDVESGGKPYAIPTSNPFFLDNTYLPEIWATGLRNPWRFSFDRLTGDLWIGDVGQNRAEEVNFQTASSKGGENYGWRLMEGLQCFISGCDMRGLALPVIEYNTRGARDVSVTGGYVYRGAQWPALEGTYIYGDYQSGRIWGLRREGPVFRNRLLLDTDFSISTFGEDEAGEVYVAAHDRSRVFRIESTQQGVRRPAAMSAANAASFEPGLVAGSAATIFGSGFAEAGIVAAQTVPLPETLAGVSVLVNGRAAPLYAVANVNGSEQVNVQIPWETVGETASAVIRRNGVDSEALTVRLHPLQPGVFTTNGADAILVRSADNRLAGELRAGDLVYFYAEGLGAVTNTPRTGAGGPTNPLAETLTRPAVTIDGVACEVLFAGLAPGFAGLYQVNIRFPAGVAPGMRDMVVRSGPATAKTVRVPVQ